MVWVELDRSRRETLGTVVSGSRTGRTLQQRNHCSPTMRLIFWPSVPFKAAKRKKIVCIQRFHNYGSCCLSRDPFAERHLQQQIVKPYQRGFTAQIGISSTIVAANITTWYEHTQSSILHNLARIGITSFHNQKVYFRSIRLLKFSAVSSPFRCP
jgi:hypothetical protein